MAPVRFGILRIDGGIISLAAFLTEHGEAVEYDLLTRTGHELRDVGDTLSWDALASFILNSDASTALGRDLDEESWLWTTQTKTNGILADIFDILTQINANLVAIGMRKPAKEAPRYPRPGKKDDAEGRKRHIGKGALPKDELRKWIERKRSEYNVRND